MPDSTSSFTLLVALPLALAGCASGNNNSAAVIIPSAVNYHVGGAGCSPAIAAFEGVIASDAQTGNLNKNVYPRITRDLAPAKSACSAARDADANNQLAAVKARYGYR